MASLLGYVADDLRRNYCITWFPDTNYVEEELKYYVKIITTENALKKKKSSIYHTYYLINFQQFRKSIQIIFLSNW